MRRLPKGFVSTVPNTPGRVSLADKKFFLTLFRKGCTNRPYYQIVVSKTTYPKERYVKWVEPFEQVGTYDPLMNKYGERLCSLNIERIIYYLSQGIILDKPVAQLLGLAGLLPQHPSTYKTAWRNRWELELQEDLKKSSAEVQNETSEENT